MIILTVFLSYLLKCDYAKHNYHVYSKEQSNPLPGSPLVLMIENE